MPRSARKGQKKDAAKPEQASGSSSIASRLPVLVVAVVVLLSGIYVKTQFVGSPAAPQPTSHPQNYTLLLRQQGGAARNFTVPSSMLVGGDLSALIAGLEAGQMADGRADRTF